MDRQPDMDVTWSSRAEASTGGLLQIHRALGRCFFAAIGDFLCFLGGLMALYDTRSLIFFTVMDIFLGVVVIAAGHECQRPDP